MAAILTTGLSQLYMLVNVLLLCQVTLGQDYHFTLNGRRIENNSLVRMENVGEGSNALLCVTPRRPCCRAQALGEWFFPDGTQVPVRASGDDFYRNRNDVGAVILNRRNGARLPNGKYRCEIPDGNRNINLRLIVGIYSDLAFPTITSQPQPIVNAVPGSRATFSVRDTGGINYRWVYNGDVYLHSTTKHLGVNTNTLIILNLSEDDEGLYHCVVEKELSVASDAARLTVLDPPIIEVQPKNVPDLVLGDDVTFTLLAMGTDLTYQWQYADGTQLQTNPDYVGVDAPTFTIRELTMEDVDFYRCAVENGAGVVYSDTLNLTLLDPPVLEVQPESISDVTPGDDVTFTLLALGTDLTYQWQYADGTQLQSNPNYVGVDTPTFTIRSVTDDDERSYRCAVSNRAGTVHSYSVELALIVGLRPVSSLEVSPDITSALVTWNNTELDPTLTGYNVVYYHQALPSITSSVNVTDTWFNAEGLLPRGRYTFELRKRSEDELGGVASVDVTLTKNIPPVNDIKVAVLNISAMHVSWKPIETLPGWNISYYKLNYNVISTKSRTERTNTVTMTTSSRDETSLVLVQPILEIGDDVRHVIEVSGVLDVGVEGVGAVEGERAVMNTTLELDEAFFQVLIGPVDYCITWTDEKTVSIRNDIRTSLARVISKQCDCEFTVDSIADGIFSCRRSSNSVTYRSTVSGFNASEIVSYIDSWVNTENPSMLIRSFYVDVLNVKDCPTQLSSLSDPECIGSNQGTTPTTLITSDPAVINCVNTCMSETGASRMCELDP